MQINEYATAILAELQRTIEAVSGEAAEQLAKRLVQADRIFVAGAGRSGLMMKAFAMRLMHLGLHAYVVGETVTPGLRANDVFLIGSGSGETRSLIAMAEKAKRLGAVIALVTISEASTLGQLADIVIHVPASPKEKADNGSTTIQPMGSLFEQSMLLLLDAVILRLMHTQELDSSAMFDKHANLE
ncbi:6-phospho-3-hexuloisomerase [Paenibacillus sp. y28]|uniref:6-phospho-3-hexuloisomerase n=1 Tax=Paenibacillus sp. y28 TaxID=3129110 RepID=UPI0030163A8E